MIGRTLHHYRILERLGRGGMGEVFLAEDEHLRRRVALKLLPPETQADPQARQRLWREARAASALSHPGIAVVYEIDEAQVEGRSLGFIAMEYVAGPTLAELAATGPLPLERVLDVAAQAAEALAAAHAGGVVHRDVKPSNVVVSESGRVKLLDFGLAYVAAAGTDDVTRSRGGAAGSGDAGLVGTLAYMAPEQALGGDVDARADVFSLGAVLYELAAGRPAFRDASAPRTLHALLHQEPPPLAGPDPRTAAFDAVLRRMLSKSPQDRQPDMAGVAADLALVRRGETPVPPRGERRVAVLGFANITRSGEDDWLGAGLAETVNADLAGVPGIEVLSRASIQEAALRVGADLERLDPPLALRVGQAAGARFVVDGGFQRAGEDVRVTARLTDVAGGTVARTVKVDGRLAGVFELQDRLSRELAAALRGDGAAPARGDETGVVGAYEAYSRGVLNLRLESYESLDRAVFLFERAVALDPGYARAHLELATALSAKADHLAIPELRERALLGFRRALELRPDLVRAWREMGSALVSLGREDEGLAAIRRALELDPEDAGALAAMGRALFIGLARFAEAADWFERALQRNPQAGWSALQLAHCAALLRQFPRGEAAARRAAELQEASLSGQEGVVIVGSYMRLGHLESLQGRHREAEEHFRRELAFVHGQDHALRSRIVIELHLRLGEALLEQGRRDAGLAALETARRAFERRLALGADEPFTRYYVACLHALRGDVEEALACLARAARGARRFTAARARIEPALRALAAEPRFRELVRPD